MKLNRTLKLVPVALLALLPTAVLTANAQTASPADKNFVTTALRGGMAEVELGKLAAAKGTSNDVKEFGQKMVTDHTQMGENMKHVALQVGASQPSKMSPADMALETKLKALSGTDFDKAYIQAMVKDHQDDLGLFNKEISGGTSSVVTNAARDGAKIIQEHLDMIQKIAQTNNVASN